MARLATYWVPFKEIARYYVGGIYRQFTEKDVFLWGQAIAFKALITVVPILVLTLGIAVRVLQDEQDFTTVARFIREFLPPYQSDQLIIFLDRLQSASNSITLIGVAGVIFSGMTLFTTLRIVISNVFQEEWHKQRTILGGYVFDLRMAAQVGLFFVLTVGFTLLIPSIGQGGLNLASRIGLDMEVLLQGWRRGINIVLWLVPYLLSLAMFFQLFFFIPKPRPPKRSALLGAVVTGLLWEAAKSTFAWYATSVGRFDRYSAGDLAPGQEGFRALGETFGLIVAFVFWVYYSGIVLIVGALIAVLHEKRHRRVRLRRQQQQAREKFPGMPGAAHPDAVGEMALATPPEEEDLPVTTAHSSPS